MGIKNTKRCMLALPSVTYAMRASELLRKHGIASAVITLEPSMTKKGCSNGLDIDCRYYSKAKELLLNNNIPLSEVSGG